MAWVAYHKFMENLFDQDNAIDLNDADTSIKIMLVTASYTPTVASDDFISDVDAAQVTGTNYTAGGNVINNKTVTLNTGTVTFDADNPATWSQSGAGFSNARYAVMYKDTGTNTTSPLICYHDFGSSKGNVDGDLSIQLSASGIMTLSSS